MPRCFRFVWNHSERALAIPKHFDCLPSNDSVKHQILQVVKWINKKSGGKQVPALVMVLVHYLALAILLIIYSLVESRVQGEFTGFILLFTPFLSFLPIVYAMVRDRPFDKLSSFLQANELAFKAKASSVGFSMTYLIISRSNLKGKEFSFYESTFLGKDFSFFIQFESRELSEFEEPNKEVLPRQTEEKSVANEIRDSQKKEFTSPKEMKRSIILHDQQMKFQKKPSVGYGGRLQANKTSLEYQSQSPEQEKLNSPVSPVDQQRDRNNDETRNPTKSKSQIKPNKVAPQLQLVPTISASIIPSSPLKSPKSLTSRSGMGVSKEQASPIRPVLKTSSQIKKVVHE